MFKNVKIVLPALLAAILLTSCGKNIPEISSEISISYGGKEIDFISEKLYTEDETDPDPAYAAANYFSDETEQGSVSPYASAGSWIEQIGEPEYYPIGSVFEIKFPENIGVPDKISINDVLITSDGKLKYDKRAAVKEAVPVINEDSVLFVLDNHYATAFSSNSEDYKKGTAYRSFGIVCEWGDEEQFKYTFCVRSDPVHIWGE